VTFTTPHILLWLPACLLLAWLAVRAVGAATRRRQLLLGAQAGRLAPRFSPARRLVRDGLAVLAVSLCLLALAGPQFGSLLRDVQQRGVDVMIVLDTSRSMLARDVTPSRLERARREIRGLLDRMHGDRIGLVTFAGDARVICPLTADPTTFRLFLDDVDTSSSNMGGTAIGEGLEKALDSFDPNVTSARVILLLSDGEDHDSDPPPSEVAYRAKVAGIPVHVVAFGAPGGAEIPIVDDAGQLGVVRDKDNRPVITEPDDDLLAGIANVAEGSFLSAVRTPFPLDEIWDKRIATMEGVTRDSSTRREGVNRFQWVLMLVLALLGARELLAEGRAPQSHPAKGARAAAAVSRAPDVTPAAKAAPVAQSARSTQSSPSAKSAKLGAGKSAALLVALLGVFAPAAAADEDRGEALLREALAALAKNDPATAVEKAKAARPDLPGSPVLANIVADAERMLGNWDDALEAYSSGAQGEYGHRAHFNAGVTGHERAEAALAEAQVPLDPAGLPEGPQPEMLKAITENVPHLERAREQFLDALDAQPGDAAARESVGALNRRLDDLRAMQAELEKRKQEEEQQQDKNKDENKDEEKDKDKEQDKQDGDKDKQDEKKEPEDPKDQQDKQDEKNKQDQPEKDKPDPKDGKPDGEPGEPKDGKAEDKLGKEQIQQLMDQLADLEKQGRELQKAREIARRQAVEKDW